MDWDYSLICSHPSISSLQPRLVSLSLTIRLYDKPVIDRCHSLQFSNATSMQLNSRVVCLHIHIFTNTAIPNKLPNYEYQVIQAHIIIFNDHISLHCFRLGIGVLFFCISFSKNPGHFGKAILGFICLGYRTNPRISSGTSRFIFERFVWKLRSLYHVIFAQYIVAII